MPVGPWNCLAGVGTDKEKDAGRIRKPLNSESIMPWVKCTLINDSLIAIGENPTISVSNISSKTIKACIKSFQFGMSNGNGATIEIVDEEGGQFRAFFDKISRGNVYQPNSFVEIEYGWATMDCKGNGFMPPPPKQCCVDAAKAGQAMRSCKHRMLVRSITCNVSEGMFKYSVECTDMTMDMFTTRTKFVAGTAAEQQYLVTAIRGMFAQWDINVDFKQVKGPCTVEDLEFNPANGKSADVSQKLGPRNLWRSEGRNPIQAARTWLNDYVSKKTRGFVSYWDSSQSKPTLVFLEANNIKCNEPASDRFNLGTYLVNSGTCSPVISFSPKIRFVMDQMYNNTGGTAGGALMPSSFSIEGPEPCLRNNAARNTETKEQGLQVPFTGNDRTLNVFGFNLGAKIASDHNLINSHANPLSPGITAELKIQGDPTFDNPVLLQGHYLTIIHFNPSRVGKARAPALNAGSFDWTNIIQNNDLSNKNWMIMKVFHEIRDGSFTTTMELKLAAPGYDIPIGRQLGGGA